MLKFHTAKDSELLAAATTLEKNSELLATATTLESAKDSGWSTTIHSP